MVVSPYMQNMAFAGLNCSFCSHWLKSLWCSPQVQRLSNRTSNCCSSRRLLWVSRQSLAKSSIVIFHILLYKHFPCSFIFSKIPFQDWGFLGMNCYTIARFEIWFIAENMPMRYIEKYDRQNSSHSRFSI